MRGGLGHAHLYCKVASSASGGLPCIENEAAYMQQVHLRCCNACSAIDAQVFTTQLHCSSGAAKLNCMQEALISIYSGLQSIPGDDQTSSHRITLVIAVEYVHGRLCWLRTCSLLAIHSFGTSETPTATQVCFCECDAGGCSQSAAGGQAEFTRLELSVLACSCWP